MCLIAFAWRSHPDYDLVLAANRDEFHARPTQAAHAWPDVPNIFGGRDGKAGGAWCAAGADGRFAAVTNYRDLQPPKPGLRSRGDLVRDYLGTTMSAGDYCESVFARRHEYGAFNLLAGDAENLFYLGNRDSRGVYGVPPGVHALSNGVFGDEWPKTRRAGRALSQAIGPASITTQDLFTLLSDDTRAPPEQLPDTGVGADAEHMLSPVFVRSPQYGTRASTVMLRPVAGPIRFIERGFNADAQRTHEVDRLWG